MIMEWEKLLSTKRPKYLQKEQEGSKVSGDKRTPFDQDFDRIIFSTPFRRLQDKTQVFPLEPNDSVRTRLTHSLEVSHAARGLAKDVCSWMLEKQHIDTGQAKDIETIAAACGLVHDLGNPPFGHSGEVAIRDWFARQSTGENALKGLDNSLADDFHNFEGNAQTLRLVAKLQILADYHGLNLTCGTMSAACKYVASSENMDKKVHDLSKLGYFNSEKSLVEQIRTITGTRNSRNPITFLVEAADDAVYNTVDIEDGFKKRILDWALIKDELKKEAGNDQLLKDVFKWAEERVDKADVSFQGHAREGALVQYFRVRAIGQIITSAAKVFQDNYAAIMAGKYHGELVEDSKAKVLLNACKTLNRSRVYCSEETLKLELMGRKIIWDLMDLFWEGVREIPPRENSFAKKAYNLLSDNYISVFKQAIENPAMPEKYYQIQLVTDYICGMTDTFAVELHRRLVNG